MRKEWRSQVLRNRGGTARSRCSIPVAELLGVGARSWRECDVERMAIEVFLTMAELLSARLELQNLKLRRNLKGVMWKEWRSSSSSQSLENCAFENPLDQRSNLYQKKRTKTQKSDTKIVGLLYRSVFGLPIPV
ncbi:hypothetical protein PS2_011063 [Malus domestica]